MINSAPIFGTITTRWTTNDQTRGSNYSVPSMLGNHKKNNNNEHNNNNANHFDLIKNELIFAWSCNAKTF